MDWLDKLTSKFYDVFCNNCGDSAHINIDNRLRCSVCGEDNGPIDTPQDNNPMKTGAK